MVEIVSFSPTLTELLLHSIDATAATPATDDVMITAPSDGDSPTEGDDVMPTEAPTQQPGLVGGKPSQFDWNQPGHETATTDNSETTTDNSGTTTGDSETTTGDSETTLDEIIDHKVVKTPNQDSADTTTTSPALTKTRERKSGHFSKTQKFWFFGFEGLPKGSVA